LDHHHPLSACLPHTKKGADLISGSSKPQKLFIIIKTTRNYIVSAAVFWLPANGIPPCLLVSPCSPRFHQGYGEFGGLKVFFENSGEIFMCVYEEEEEGSF